MIYGMSILSAKTMLKILYMKKIIGDVFYIYLIQNHKYINTLYKIHITNITENDRYIIPKFYLQEEESI